MILGALLDLGADPRPVRESIRSVSRHLNGCKSVDLKVSEVKRGEFRASRAEIRIREKYETRTGSELLAAVKAVSEENGFDEFQRRLAANSLQTLVKAEAKLHGERPEKVGLDEAGSADTVADIIGTVTALRELEIGEGSEVYSLPIAVGGGLFKFSHGLVQAPAPAVIEIASRYRLAIVGGPIQVELATPTGVSVLANLATRSGSDYPPFTPEKVGYGAGKRDFSEFPNILRAVIGKQALHRIQEAVAVLETNLDDVTGETLGFIMTRLLEEEALDVQVIPAVGKKGRPSELLRVIANPESAAKLTEIMFEESGTLGVRTYQVMREVAARGIERVSFKVAGRRLSARVKVSRDDVGKVVNVKPEYEDIASLARRFHIPLRRLHDAAVREAEGKLNS